MLTSISVLVLTPSVVLTTSWLSSQGNRSYLVDLKNLGITFPTPTFMPTTTPPSSDASSCSTLPKPTVAGFTKYLAQLAVYLANPKYLPPEAHMTVAELVAYNGYTFKEETVVTEDGYLLLIHRIPDGRLGETKICTGGRRVVILAHGFLCSSSEWIHNRREQVLAYRLADACYDVWMMNFRGNQYSNCHLIYPSDSSLYWNFGLHELGLYDVPAVIEAIKVETGKESIYYVGHSMGATALMIALSIYPKLSTRMLGVALLGGPIYFDKQDSWVIDLLAAFYGQVGAKEFALALGQGKFLTGSPAFITFRDLYAPYSVPDWHATYVTALVIGQVVGYNWCLIDDYWYPIQISNFPTTAATGIMASFMQLNQCKYPSITDVICKDKCPTFRPMATLAVPCPAEYNLSNVKCPTYHYVGPGDLLAPLKQLTEALALLPQAKVKIIDHPSFNHMDFLWATGLNELLNDDIIKQFDGTATPSTVANGRVGGSSDGSNLDTYVAQPLMDHSSRAGGHVLGQNSLLSMSYLVVVLVFLH